MSLKYKKTMYNQMPNYDFTFNRVTTAFIKPYSRAPPGYCNLYEKERNFSQLSSAELVFLLQEMAMNLNSRVF